jgi:poly-gamma-glutamate capsule biosynthesis protein CapA/YwtB (metallophosphatase superfamily)
MEQQPTFVGHRVPMLKGIEIYDRRPIFYSLGNFVFHSPQAANYRDERVWQSVVAVCGFVRGSLASVRLFPITVDGVKALPDDGPTRPCLIDREDGQAILKRLARLSGALGTEI